MNKIDKKIKKIALRGLLWELKDKIVKYNIKDLYVIKYDDNIYICKDNIINYTDVLCNIKIPKNIDLYITNFDNYVYTDKVIFNKNELWQVYNMLNKKNIQNKQRTLQK